MVVSKQTLPNNYTMNIIACIRCNATTHSLENQTALKQFLVSTTHIENLQNACYVMIVDVLEIFYIHQSHRLFRNL